MSAASTAAPGQPEDLVFAICHEVGNLVGAIRLNAHLIDDQASPVELAQASVEIDDSSARIRSLLALIRPLLTADAAGPARSATSRPESVVRGVGEALEEIGARGVEVQVTGGLGLAEVCAQHEILHHLLLTLAFHAIEEARPHGHVVLGATGGANGCVEFFIVDDGREDPELGEPSESPATGRGLAFAVARVLLDRIGGGVEATRSGERTHVVLQLPGSA
jgi:signal transduction histidine kinase